MDRLRSTWLSKIRVRFEDEHTWIEINRKSDLTLSFCRGKLIRYGLIKHRNLLNSFFKQIKMGIDLCFDWKWLYATMNKTNVFCVQILLVQLSLWVFIRTANAGYKEERNELMMRQSVVTTCGSLMGWEFRYLYGKTTHLFKFDAWIEYEE